MSIVIKIIKSILIIFIILSIVYIIFHPKTTDDSGIFNSKIFTCKYMSFVAISLCQYKIIYGVYPSQEEGLAVLVKNPKKKYDYNSNEVNLFDKMPTDSLGNPFVYIKQDDKFELISLGIDKKRYTDDDIYYSQCPQHFRVRFQVCNRRLNKGD